MGKSEVGGATGAGLEITIGPMQADDWPAVSEIYAEGLATGNATFETSVPDREQWEANRLPFGRLVARTRDGRIVGWAALARTSRKQILAGVAEVSVYVAGGARGRGVARRLLDRLVRESEDAGVWTLQASVFPENEATLRLHEGAGFRVVGRREKIAMHEGRWRDTLLLERRSDRAGLAAE